jgi:integrase
MNTPKEDTKLPVVPLTMPLTLKEQFEMFLDNLRKVGKSKQSIRSYGNTYRLYVNSGRTVVDDLAVEGFLERYDNPATANKALAHIRSFAAFMARKFPHTNIPTLGSFTLEQKKLELTLPIVLSDPDQAAFMDALEKISYIAWAHLTIIRNTGLRFSEAYDLTASHYYEPAPGTHAIKFRGKGRQERQVALNAPALLAFKVWTAQRAKPSPNTLRYAHRKAEQDAGVKIRPHWFSSLGRDQIAS